MVERVLLGNSSGTQVLKVSKPGINVLTATDADLMFDSRYPFYRARATYTFSFVETTGSLQTQTINHGLGVRPLALFSNRRSNEAGSHHFTVASVKTTSTQLIVAYKRPTTFQQSPLSVFVTLLTEDI